MQGDSDTESNRPKGYIEIRSFLGVAMSDDEDIDLDRVVSDPSYRRQVMAFLNAEAETDGETAKSRAHPLAGARQDGRRTA
jgi:hypothetical protein